MNGQVLLVKPVFDNRVRGLCVKPYPRHPKGCPNFNKCDRCPPKVLKFAEYFDCGFPIYAVINEFDLASHSNRMLQSHDWSYEQSVCVLYWQNTARKELRELIDTIIPAFPGYESTWCPEGMGMDVTATLKTVGIELEWPAVKIARQVAILAMPL